MELVPESVSRTWSLLVFGAATVVGVPLLIWRAQADDSVAEVAEIFVVAAFAALLVVSVWSVWRTRRSMRRAQPVPADATVKSGGRGWALLFVGLGVCGGLAPFGRDGFNDGDSTFAAFGHGVIVGVLAGLFIGLLYLRRREAAAGELLVRGAGKGHGKQYFVR